MIFCWRWAVIVVVRGDGTAAAYYGIRVVYHLLNRRVMRLTIFEKEADYAAFERCAGRGLDRPDAPKLLAYCLMPNHWHLVVHAGDETDLSTWMQWVTVTHTHRWHAHYHSAVKGVVPGPVQELSGAGGVHFLIVCRYVEGNAGRADLVDRAEIWRWSSLWVRRTGEGDVSRRLKPWPVDRPRNWVADVNRPMDEEALKVCCGSRPDAVCLWGQTDGRRQSPHAWPGDYPASPWAPRKQHDERENHPDTFSDGV
jgi:putative transposase